MTRYADGSGRCEFCKSKYTNPRKDKLYCSIKCQRKAKYARIRKEKHCVLCKVVCKSKYCSDTCEKLVYKILRARRKLHKLSQLAIARRHQRSGLNKYKRLNRSGKIELLGVKAVGLR